MANKKPVPKKAPEPEVVPEPTSKIPEPVVVPPAPEPLPEPVPAPAPAVIVTPAPEAPAPPERAVKTFTSKRQEKLVEATVAQGTLLTFEMYCSMRQIPVMNRPGMRAYTKLQLATVKEWNQAFLAY